MRFIWRFYAGACGLLLAPVLVAIALAHFTGRLSVQELGARLTAGAEVAPPSAVEIAGGRPATTEGAAVPLPPPDLRTWERRLHEMGAGIVSNVQDLNQEYEKLKGEAEHLDALARVVAQLASVALDETVAPETLVPRSAELLERLEKERAEVEGLPKVLATLQTVEPRALAAIFAGNDGSPGLDEEQSVVLLSGFPPRKAGEVLAEVGKKDPALAARIVTRLGGRTPATGVSQTESR